MDDYEYNEGKLTELTGAGEPVTADEAAEVAEAAEKDRAPGRSRRGGARKGETKREKFVRLSEQRTNRVLDALRILGNCSNRASNEYTGNDVEQIFGAIEEVLQETKDRFLFPERRKGEKFRLNPR